MNLIPFHSKLHPKLRFTSLDPLPDREGLGLVAPFHVPPPRTPVPVGRPSGGAAGASDATAAMPDRAVFAAKGDQVSVDVALAEIAALTGSRGV